MLRRDTRVRVSELERDSLAPDGTYRQPLYDSLFIDCYGLYIYIISSWYVMSVGADSVHSHVLYCPRTMYIYVHLSAVYRILYRPYTKVNVRMYEPARFHAIYIGDDCGRFYVGVPVSLEVFGTVDVILTLCFPISHPILRLVVENRTAIRCTVRALFEVITRLMNVYGKPSISSTRNT